ncbi:cell division protein PerM [Leucobacter komagatae]|uniref:Uncharacterized protein n=1 Tax=Leucobacter komagatae TaxID=55969 RepID=A0A0D0H4Y7_9MICO|nr:DUF6350 family protein [Leucobacter komagatae]KIP52220.1 hypothetical protein SD72_10185 [Leucobacter komagatae]
MRAILTGVVATIEAVAVALASLLVVAGLAFLVWWLAFDLGAEPGAVFAGAGAAWLLAHFVPLTIELSAETMQLFGFAPDALSFPLSLAPLGITLVTVGFAVRAGWRFGARGGAGAAGVLGGAAGFGAVTGTVSSFAPLAQPGWIGAAIIGALVYGVSSGLAFLIRAGRDEHQWWIALLSTIEVGLAKLGVRRPAVFPHRAGQTLRLAAMLVAGYVGLSGLVLAVGLLTQFAVIVGASEALQLDLWGTILMFVLQLALLPVLLLWTGAWLSGAGFAVGAGSSASPFGQLLGPMPGLPVLSAIPDGWGSAAVLAPVLLALVGVAVGVSLGRAARGHSRGWLALQVTLAAALAGLTIALLNWASSGSLGPGRLETVGPEVWPGAGLAAAWLGLGCFLGALAARADIARRVAHAPVDVLQRVGAGGLGAGGLGAAEIAAADDAAASEPDPHDPQADDQPEEHLAPVDPLWPREADRERAPEAAGAARSVRLDSEAESDEQITEPFGAETFVSAHDGNQRDADYRDSDASDGETDVLADLDATPEAELFDQHSVDDARAAAGRSVPEVPESRASAYGTPEDLDPEALIEAYSWDNVDADEAPAVEQKRAGWRWPGRKG